MLQTLRQVQSGSGIGLKAGNGVLGVVVFKFPFLKKKKTHSDFLHCVWELK